MATSKGKPSPAAKAAPAATPAKPVLAAAPPAAAKPAAKAAAKPAIDAGERQRMIAEAAYYIAEKRGFVHGNHDADWAEAERQIDEILSKRA